MATVKRKLRPNVKKALEDLKSNPELQPIVDPPLREVTGIQFGILSPEEILAISVCRVTKSKISPPLIETVYDDRMGPPDPRGSCSTCSESIRVCPGHFGHIELTTPIFHPQFVRYIVNILNCVCLVCSKLRLSEEELNLELHKEEDNDRFMSYIDRLRTVENLCSNVPFCKHCKEPNPEITLIEGKIYKLYPSSNKKEKKRSMLGVEEVRSVLKKIAQHDLKIMGFQMQQRVCYKHNMAIKEVLETFRPEWLILTRLPVLPPVSRPPDYEDGKKSDDDLTSSYTEIIKSNEKLADESLKEKNRQEILTSLEMHISSFIDNSDEKIKHTSGKPIKSIKERISSKYGHIRGKLMGKRVDCSARTVITADTTLRLNQVGVPEWIASTLSFPEHVTARNLREMSDLMLEGKINMVLRGQKTYLSDITRNSGKNMKLRIGDVAYRQLRDGDTVIFNRQPTLHRGSMMAHYVKVLPGKTFRLNLSVTTPYNADKRRN